MQIENSKFQQALMPDKLLKTVPVCPPLRTRGASANISISQLIFDGGSSVAKIDQARANAFIAEMDVELAANSTAKDAAVSWINLDTLLQARRTVTGAHDQN